MHAVVELRSGLELESFFETMHGLARDGETNEWDLPWPLQLAVLADAYREESLAGVPTPVERVLASATTPVGRLAGFRTRYERYDDSA